MTGITWVSAGIYGKKCGRSGQMALAENATELFLAFRFFFYYFLPNLDQYDIGVRTTTTTV